MTKIVYSLDRPITVDDLKPLFQQTGWTNTRTPEAMAIMLQNSPVILGAWDGDTLVGFVRVLTDDIYRAFIEDVIVTGELRGQGIGAQMIQRVKERLSHVEEIILTCEEGRIPFYSRQGFKVITQPRMNIWQGK